MPISQRFQTTFHRNDQVRIVRDSGDHTPPRDIVPAKHRTERHEADRPPHEVETPTAESSTGQQPPTAQRVADEPIAEQLRIQADQLAGHLRNRQKELDHREAELNSRIARLESESRSARLWLGQRESDLASRGEELAKQQEELLRGQQEVEKRLARLAAAEAAQQKHAKSPPTAAKGAAEKSPKALAARQRQLDDAEAKLAEAQTKTQELHDQLLGQQRAFAEETAAIREQMAAEHRQAMADLEQSRQTIQRRADHVDRCRAALGQLRPNWATCTAKPWKSAWRRRNSGHSFPAPHRRPRSPSRWAASARSWPINIAKPTRNSPSRGRNWRRSASS